MTDAVNDPGSKLGDFHYNAGTKGAADYSYDPNGNLISDQNKDITGIVYNYLNLPQQITINGKGTITYTYDASGDKLKKTTIDNTVTPTKTTVTLYINTIQYQNDSIQFIGHEEGRARWALHNYTTGTSAYGWEYDLFEKDHLGNTRIVLTQQKDTAQYEATMEDAFRDKEKALFSNIDETSVSASTVPGGYPDDNTPPQPNKNVARVSGSVGSQKVGPALLLKVMSGDGFDIGTKSFYRSGGAVGTPNSSVPDLLNSSAQGLISIAGPGHGAAADLNNTSGSPVYAALNSFMATNDSTPSDRPRAYLNWMLLDNQFNYVADGSGAKQVQSPDAVRTLAQHVDIHHSGYLYIWVSNETPNWDVFFDNLSVNHYSGPLVEETHYYPFGLTMAGISDHTLLSNYATNKYRYNGKELGDREFSDGSGLEEYDYGARSYEPQIGRWIVPDPSTDKYYGMSPYTYVNNDPLNNIDLEGRDVIVVREHKVYEINEIAKTRLNSKDDVLRFPPKSVHDFGVTGVVNGLPGGVTYVKNEKTGKYDVKLTVVEFVNSELRPGGQLDSGNPGLSKEVAAHEEGHGDQFEEAFKSTITVNSGWKGGKFTGRIDEVLNQAGTLYDEIAKQDPAAAKKYSKKDYINTIFLNAIYSIYTAMKSKDEEADANKRASKKLAGSMPYTIGLQPIGGL
ncbi:RHS repeat-associated core domain-containing protein [Puia sp. P3]|uniref:RHS repeat-associated core domain-containing protein n=1 Tax=Puia sp. P3 TaxID=3423952 RepID=UPI003D67021D